MRKLTTEDMRNEYLYEAIVEKREEMHDMADDFGIESAKTLSVSQELDNLINLYIRDKLEEKSYNLSKN
ncbi:aspartyl-phosphate phosphatase Spo0E family protein [Salinibacillus xinjiangensis]|uniref:Spo0E family sporulation regulatory protein-aspartic acid phosphatase n=1 Tax=Salinibacillus xinjiangensis TaxID=1229268 RepID=A0A6G1X3M5_9BACI|nr:aspartyl-phosphate phosphatase Spo0E family protein [Salinibacillus xinjiangensis]MRG85591.1 Spo0E family sporulation regulatory protein-aspartic acid phosphatase [Salinibacillus xinjiangensis]